MVKPKFEVVFFRTTKNNEPVREWLKSLPKDDRKIIGEDIMVVQFRWPIGRPLVGKLDDDLWEVRSNIKNSIARTIFTVCNDSIVLLHGIIKKTQKLPINDLEIAKRRLRMYIGGEDK